MSNPTPSKPTPLDEENLEDIDPLHDTTRAGAVARQELGWSTLGANMSYAAVFATGVLWISVSPCSAYLGLVLVILAPVAAITQHTLTRSDVGDAGVVDLVVFREWVTCAGVVPTALALTTDWGYLAAAAVLAALAARAVAKNPFGPNAAILGGVYLLVAVPVLVVYKEWWAVQFTAAAAVIGGGLLYYQERLPYVREFMHCLAALWFYDLAVVATKHCARQCH